MGCQDPHQQQLRQEIQICQHILLGKLDGTVVPTFQSLYGLSYGHGTADSGLQACSAADKSCCFTCVSYLQAKNQGGTIIFQGTETIWRFDDPATSAHASPKDILHEGLKDL